MNLEQKWEALETKHKKARRDFLLNSLAKYGTKSKLAAVLGISRQALHKRFLIYVRGIDIVNQ